MSFDEWNEYELGEFFDLISGFAFKSKEFQEKGVPVLKIKNIKPLNVKYDELAYVSPSYLNSKSKFIVKKDDLLISMTGNRIEGTPETWVGKVSYFNKEEPFLVNQRVGILRNTNETKISNRFMVYKLSTEEMQKYFISIATSSGGQANISPTQILGTRLKLPPLSTQQKVASILSALDEKIELNNRMNKVLEQMAQAIFKQWFVDFEFPNENGEPYKSSGGEMEWCEELGKEIPKGWRIGCLADIAEILMGQSPKSEFYNTTGEGLPFHQGVANYGYRYPVHNVFCSHLLRVARKGSILMSVRAPVGRLNIADRDIVIGRGLCAITPKHNYYSYLFALLQTVFAVEDRYGSGTIFNSISKKELENIKIIIPTMELMRLFDEVASSYDSKISNNCNQISLLSQTRDTLLPKLMSGEIDVSEIEL